jgi:hypothetical protein
MTVSGVTNMTLALCYTLSALSESSDIQCLFFSSGLASHCAKRLRKRDLSKEFWLFIIITVKCSQERRHHDLLPQTDVSLSLSRCVAEIKECELANAPFVH